MSECMLAADHVFMKEYWKLHSSKLEQLQMLQRHLKMPINLKKYNTLKA